MQITAGTKDCMPVKGWVAPRGMSAQQRKENETHTSKFQEKFQEHVLLQVKVLLQQLS